MPRLAIVLVALIILALLAVRGGEPASAAILTVDTTVDDPSLVACTVAANDCSLRGAITVANNTPGDDIVSLDNSQTYLLDEVTANEDLNAGGDLDILDGLTINGNGATVMQTVNDRVFDVLPGGGDSTVSLEALTLKGGMQATEPGGGVRVSAGVFNTAFVTIRDNYSNENGGGIAIDSGVEATIMGSLITENTGAVNLLTDGGGLYFGGFGPAEGFLHIEGSDFIHNLGRQSGGGLAFFADQAALTMIDTDFSENYTNIGTGVGGGFRTQGGNITMTGGTVEKNSTTGYGGGAYIITTSGTISGVTFNDNGAFFAGGLSAITADNDLLLDRLIITNNDATFTGGGALLDRVTMSNTDVSFNHATDHGGGIVIDSPSVTVDHSLIASNSTTTGDGGGVFIPSGGATIENTTINANSAHDSGGGIFIGEPAGYDSLDWPAVPIFANFVTVDNNSSLSGASNVHDVESGSAIQFTQSIVAYGGAQPSCNAEMSSGGNNVEDLNTCIFNEPGDRPSTDPLLSSLTDNGGPTRTQALIEGSGAIDVGGNCPPPVDDQRGYVRENAGFGCDAGAFEVDATPPTPSPTPSPSPTPTPTPTASPTPSVTPTGTVTPTPTSSPLATPTGEPTPSPTPTGTGQPQLLKWSDSNCNGEISLGDAIGIARKLVSLPVNQEQGCPELGSSVQVDGVPRLWEDVDCGGTLALGDAIGIARFLVSLPVNQGQECPAVGSEVQVS